MFPQILGPVLVSLCVQRWAAQKRCGGRGSAWSGARGARKTSPASPGLARTTHGTTRVPRPAPYGRAGPRARLSVSVRRGDRKAELWSFKLTFASDAQPPRPSSARHDSTGTALARARTRHGVGGQPRSAHTLLA